LHDGWEGSIAEEDATSDSPSDRRTQQCERSCRKGRSAYLGQPASQHQPPPELGSKRCPVVVGQRIRPARPQRIVEHSGSQFRQAQTRVKAARGQWRDGSCRVAHQKTFGTADATQHTANGNRAAAPLNVVGAGETMKSWSRSGETPE
jgi:hypothetical protein